jgi:hypothetical protein
MGYIRTGIVRIVLVLAAGFSPVARAEVYLEPDKFIEECFPEEPEQKMLWLKKELKEEVKEILGHPYKGLRIRYWELNGETAWILDEIGKVEPITAGFLVEKGKLINMQVLIYRETHGWEVKYPFFSKQFKGLGLRGKRGLDKKIDGISGATLSVNALVRMSELALFLDAEARK